jgi:hypothetical protein
VCHPALPARQDATGRIFCNASVYPSPPDERTPTGPIRIVADLMTDSRSRADDRDALRFGVVLDLPLEAAEAKYIAGR